MPPPFRANSWEAAALTLTTCPDPDCGAPAEEVDRYVLASTSGPLVHVATMCARRHHYTHTEE